MKNDHILMAIAGALGLALLGIIVLAIIRIPAPEILTFVATSAVGALVMAARGNNGGNGGGGGGDGTAPASAA